MFTNKRQLKKRFSAIAEDVVVRVLPAAVYADAITDEKAEELITKISVVKAEAMARLSVSFDKSPRDFADGAAYRKAHREYYHKAYEAAKADFEKGITEVLATINDALRK